MFLKDEIKHYAIGTYLGPFCKDCNSKNIKVTEKCKDCGSTNISRDYNDPRSQSVRYHEKQVSIYKCDKCGKEFEKSSIDDTISYAEGSFEPSRYCSEYIEYLYYHLDKDLCKECREKLTDRLNSKLAEIYDTSNVTKEVNKFLGDDSIA